MNNCYYSLIRSGLDGRVFGWVPDLPGVIADGTNEEAVVSDLTSKARTCLQRIVAKALPVPVARSAEEFPYGDHHGRYRRLLLVL
jgi:predicted RNase H-like HicB family nuclease